MDTIAKQEVEVLLQTAITILRRGEPLPLDLVFDLAQEGVDVETIERKYFY